MTDGRRVAYVIAFSAPPVLQLDKFVRLLGEQGWDAYVILSPTAATWVDVDHLVQVSGHPVRVEPRRPQDPDHLPPADAMIAAPMTFNSLNKWALGISDTLALGLLNESLGLDTSIIAAPCVNRALQKHPTYKPSIDRLAEAGVHVLSPDSFVSRSESAEAVIDWTCAIPQ